MLLRSVLAQVFRRTVRSLTPGCHCSSMWQHTGSVCTSQILSHSAKQVLFREFAADRGRYVADLWNAGHLRSAVGSSKSSWLAEKYAERERERRGVLLKPCTMWITCRSHLNSWKAKELRWNMFEDPATPAVLAYAICLCKGLRLRAISQIFHLPLVAIFRYFRCSLDTARSTDRTDAVTRH